MVLEEPVGERTDAGEVGEVEPPQVEVGIGQDDDFPAAVPALHVALMRYNDACWYVHEVVTLAGRYTSSVPPLAPSRDPFVRALVTSPRIAATTSHGCDPATDLASGRLDLRVCYCSVFEECWINSLQAKDPEPVVACPAATVGYLQ